MGKPSAELAQLFVARHGLDPRRTCMVGDRCNTDVLFGRRGGMKTLLVLSGASTLEDARAAPPEQQPDAVAASVAVLLRGLN